MERLLGPPKAIEMMLGAMQSLDVCPEVSDLALPGTQKTCTRRRGRSFRGPSVWTLLRSVARRLQRCVPEDLEGCTGGDRYRWALCCSLQAAHTELLATASGRGALRISPLLASSLPGRAQPSPRSSRRGGAATKRSPAAQAEGTLGRQALAILLGENLSALPPHAMRALAARPRQFDLRI